MDDVIASSLSMRTPTPRRNDRREAARLWLNDTVIVFAATGAAGILAHIETGRLPEALAVAAIAALVWLIMTGVFGVQHPRASVSRRSEYVRIGQATGVAFGALAILFVLLRLPGLRLQLLVALPVGLIALLLTHWLYRSPSGSNASRDGVSHADASVVRSAKRAGDIAVSLLGTLIVAALTPLIAIAIRADSKGPVFFRQQRVGAGGREFTLRTFRTMADPDEQELDELLPTTRRALRSRARRPDPRLTRVGRVLRVLSLDTSPQLFSVLKGDMSLVGPRAYSPSEVRNREGTVVRQVSLRPGLTGLWRVSGRRELSMQDRDELDRQYVDNWSMSLDAMILWRSITLTLQPSGSH